MSDGNIGGLIKNVAHGTANSTAKLTGSLSYGISKATVHERYDERRLMLRRRRGEKSKEHLMAGLKGLGFGVLGGLTSIGIVNTNINQTEWWEISLQSFCTQSSFECINQRWTFST